MLDLGSSNGCSELYGRELVDLRNEGRWEFLNTLFSISESVMFMQVNASPLLVFLVCYNCVLVKVESQSHTLNLLEYIILNVLYLFIPQY